MFSSVNKSTSIFFLLYQLRQLPLLYRRVVPPLVKLSIPLLPSFVLRKVRLTHHRVLRVYPLRNFCVLLVYLPQLPLPFFVHGEVVAFGLLFGLAGLLGNDLLEQAVILEVDFVFFDEFGLAVGGIPGLVEEVHVVFGGIIEAYFFVDDVFDAVEVAVVFVLLADFVVELVVVGAGASERGRFHDIHLEEEIL